MYLLISVLSNFFFHSVVKLQIPKINLWFTYYIFAYPDLSSLCQMTMFCLVFLAQHVFYMFSTCFLPQYCLYIKYVCREQSLQVTSRLYFFYFVKESFCTRVEKNSDFGKNCFGPSERVRLKTRPFSISWSIICYFRRSYWSVIHNRVNTLF